MLLHLGPISLYWYGLLIALGFVIAVGLTMRLAQREGLDSDRVLSAALVATLIGLLTARIYFIATTNPGYYLNPKHMSEALSLATSGLSYFGGVVGVVMGAWVYCSRYGLPLPRILDLAAVSAPLGQAVGRLGNLLNGDVQGRLTRGFGIEYTNPRNPFLGPDRLGQTAHSVALYEMVYDVLLFAGLWVLYRRQKPDQRAPGLLAAVYLAGYSVGRLFIAAYEVGPAAALGLRQVQLAALVGFAVALALILSDRFPRTSPPVAQAAEVGEVEEQPAT